MKCTFAGCAVSDHIKPLHTVSDNIILCDEHKTVWDAAAAGVVDGGRYAPKLLSVWVKAQGGAEAAAQRMRPQIDAMARFLSAFVGRGGKA